MAKMSTEMSELRRLAQQQQLQLQESQRQLEASQRNVESLSSALACPSTPSAPPTAPSIKKNPDLPPFDTQNIEIGLQRIKAAYQRDGIVLGKDNNINHLYHNNDNLDNNHNNKNRPE